MEETITYLFLGEGLLLLTFALLESSARNIGRIKSILAFIYLSLGYIWAYYGLYRATRFTWAPWLLYTDIVATFLLGPALYSYVRELMGAPQRNGLSLLPYMPALAALTGIVLLRPTMVVLSGPNPDYSSISLIDLINQAGNAHFLVYAIVSIWTLVRRAGKLTTRSRKAAPYIITFLLLLLITFLVLAAGSLFRQDGSIIAGLLLNGINSIGFFFLSYRYPEYTQKPLLAPLKASALKDHPASSTADGILERVQRLVETERAYHDPDMTLQSLSHRLGLEHHQLSQVLNQRLGTNFRTYLNGFRIEEAKRLLAESPEMSVLDIGFAVGFNSKSSFNSVFMTSTGCSPSKFRKKNAGNV